MEAPKGSCSNANARLQILLAQLPPQRHIGSISRCLPLKRMKKFSRPVVVRAKSGDCQRADSGGWSIVDANMIVLRKRILELKAQEVNYELQEDWLEREKKYRQSYQIKIGWLHYAFFNAPPTVGLALLSLMTMLIPTSFLVAMMALLHQLSSRS